jgi:hypothetical protein
MKYSRPGPPVPGIAVVPGEFGNKATLAFEVIASPSIVQRNEPIALTIRAVSRSDNSTATGFVSDSVMLWTTNWSPAKTDYTGGKACDPACSGGGYDCMVYPPAVTVWNPAADPEMPNMVSFTVADAGVKTLTIRLKNGGVGTSYRIEALYPPPKAYPYYDLMGASVVRGWSNRIFVGTGQCIGKTQCRGCFPAPGTALPGHDAGHGRPRPNHPLRVSDCLGRGNPAHLRCPRQGGCGNGRAGKNHDGMEAR